MGDQVPTAQEMRDGGCEQIPDWVGVAPGVAMAHPSEFEGEDGAALRAWLETIPNLGVETSPHLARGSLFWVRRDQRPPGTLPRR